MNVHDSTKQGPQVLRTIVSNFVNLYVIPIGASKVVLSATV